MAKPSSTEPQQGGTKDFTLVSRFNYGYRNREDVTTLPAGILVKGSQNVLTNTFQRVGIRKGFTLDGQANSALAPIGGNDGAMGVFDWLTSEGLERNMRAGFLTSLGNDGKLQFRYVHDDDTVEWLDLLTNLTSVNFNYTTFWDVATARTVMLAVNGESNIIEWNGAQGVLDSASASPSGIPMDVDFTPNNATIHNDSGGVDYAAGDVLTISGGGANAVLTVFNVGPGALKTVSIGAAGSGYSIGDTLVLAPTDPLFREAVLTITATGGGGTVTGVSIKVNGIGYSNVAGAPTTTGGGGSGCTINILATGNGITQLYYASDADFGSGYSTGGFVALTGGSGTNASIEIFSVTSGSITKEGPETWAESGFDTFGADDGQITINGTVYTYNKLNRGDTLTIYGITPSPAAEPHGSVIVQTPVIVPNQGVNQVPPGLPLTFKNDLIGTINGRVFIGSLTNSEVWISQLDSFTLYGIASPAVVGSGYLIVLTSPPTAFIPQEGEMYISAGTDQWYNISFTLSADLTQESIQINRLNTTALQAAQNQAATNKIKNDIVFLSFEPIINTFGRVTDVLANTPQMTDLSYPIVNDMNNYDWSNAAICFYRKFIYIAVPAESLVLAYNMTDNNNQYWEAPQVMGISRFSIIDGELYGHSNAVSETYKLFTGTNDNGAPVLARASFAFNNYGTRSQSKGYNEFYVEGYISANTTLNLGIQYDIDGCATQTFFEIDGDDTQIVCIANQDNSLGKFSLGKQPLGSIIAPSDDAFAPPKFRVIKTFPTRYFYEDQISFYSEDIDAQWDILAFGPQLQAFGSLNNNITQ